MAVSGDPSQAERFATLLASCQRPVFLYAMSLLHNAADAEEALQETNLVLWRKFDQYDPEGSFVRWACGVAHFEVLKIRERKSRHERLLSDRFVAALATQSQRSLDLLDNRRQALAGCLAKLNENDRRLVTERYQPNATTRSVATAIGRSLQGTQKALHRIRMALLACVERSLAMEKRT